MGIQYCHSQSISVQIPCKYYCATKGTLTKYVVLAYVTFTLRSIKVSKNQHFSPSTCITKATNS